MVKTDITEATEKGLGYGNILTDFGDNHSAKMHEIEEELLAAGWTKSDEMLKKMYPEADDRDARVYIFGDRLAHLCEFGNPDDISILVDFESTLENAIKALVSEVEELGYDWKQRVMDLDVDYVLKTMEKLGWKRIDSVPQEFDCYIGSMHEHNYFENEKMYAVTGVMQQVPTKPNETTTIFMTLKEDYNKRYYDEEDDDMEDDDTEDYDAEDYATVDYDYY